MEYNVLDLAHSGRKLLQQDSQSSLNQDGSTLKTGGVRHFNVITAEKTSLTEVEPKTYQLGFSGMSGGTAKDYADTVKEKICDIKTCCQKLNVSSCEE